MIDKSYMPTWEALKLALADTDVSREYYRESLEEMVADLEGRLMAVTEELRQDEEDGES